MFRSTLQAGFDKRRLQIWLLLFFLAISVPTFVLIHQAYRQLKWEAFHQHLGVAEELVARIDARFVDIINNEEIRSFGDFSFLIVAGDPSASFLQRSPLSGYPVSGTLPGLIGYFQINGEGEFSTPLVPTANVDAGAYGISDQEYRERLALQQQLYNVLSQNRLVRGRQPEEPALRRYRASDEKREAGIGSRDDEKKGGADKDAVEERASVAGTLASPASEAAQARNQAAFDELNQTYSSGESFQDKPQRPNTLGRVADLELDSRLETGLKQSPLTEPVAQTDKLAAVSKRMKRKEQAAVPEPERQLESPGEGGKYDRQDIPISTFESEIDPFDFSLLDSGHFVLFRKVWREGQRYIQGAVIEQAPFIRDVVQSAFAGTALSRMSDLIVAYQGDVLTALSGESRTGYLSTAAELSGSLLYQTRLSDPLGDLQLIFTINRLPAGPGGTLIGWVSLILVTVLLGGFYLMYRLGVGQINLARQQQDFVSAVSHELKTPLTSIRMYGEILRAGWADESKKKTYYDYIYDESERLSRLIANVLQLARMTRNDPQFDLKPVRVGELMDLTESKIATSIDQAGFQLKTHRGNDVSEAAVVVDTDCFIQIIINLVDNAIKFSAHADKKMIELSCYRHKDGVVVFSVRDFGPGVPRDQMKKIFKLFYRSENELTRETVGTGIGLALVHQLTLAMNGKVDVRNHEPGAEFRVYLPVEKGLLSSCTG